MKRLMIGLALLSEVACTKFPGGPTTTSNKPQTSSSGRPSENGEGVPGYLADAKAISFTYDGTMLSVVGGVGNLHAEIEYNVLPIYVYRLIAPTDANVRKLGDDAYEVTGELLFSSFANPDGSILARGPDSGVGPYIMKVGGASTDPLQISAYQTHVTYVFSEGPGAQGQLLSLKLLREKYPDVFASSAPLLADKPACNAAMRYWNSMSEECSTLGLAKLENCWPTPDGKALVSMLEDKVSDRAESELKSLYKSGAALDQCYYSERGPQEIEIVFIETMEGGIKLARVAVDASDVKKYVAP